MLIEKKADHLILISYVCIILFHITYGNRLFSSNANRSVLLVVFLSTACLFLVQILLHQEKYRLLKLVLHIFIMVGLSCFVGYHYGLLAYTPIMYIIMCVEFSAYTDLRINIILALICKIAMFLTKTLAYDVVTAAMNIHYYGMICAFFDLLAIFNLFVVVFQKKQQNILRRRTEDLIQSQKSREDFLANVSHELRTPLNVIIGMCELMLRERGLPESSRNYGESIESAGQNLLSIVNDILDLSKSVSGKMELVEEPYSISGIISDMITLAQAKSGGKNLDLIFVCNPNLPSVLYGDEQRIRQIFTNLVTNAIKYTPSGVVYVYVDRHPTSYGINLRISVQDTGIGIRRENLDLIFGAFNQVDMHRNRRIEGTGLGLPIAKQLTQAMGGFIHAKSEYNAGSEFFVTLPQKIVDSTPILSVKSTESVNILVCTSPKSRSNYKVHYYHEKFFNHIATEFSISFTYCTDISELDNMLQKQRYTHIAVDALYQKYPAIFIKLSRRYPILLLMDFGQKPSNLPGFRYLTKPLNSFSVISAINGDTASALPKRRKHFEAHFLAPDAKLLIVDDNPLNLKVVTGLLEPYHMQIDTAQSGREALDLLEHKTYHLIFMDHMMPEMDGIETTKRIRAKGNSSLREIPVIAFSASTVSDAGDLFLGSGFQDYITKPVESLALERALHTWLPISLQLPPDDSDGISVPASPPDISSHPKELSADSAKHLQENGISYTDALHFCNDSAEQYILIAKMFCDNYKKQSGTLRQFLNEQRQKDYQIAVHGLKTNAKTLGADQLFELALKQENAARAANFGYLTAHWDELHTEWYRIVVLLSSL